MPVVALDTHAVVKELQAAGFTEAQAEAVTRAVRKGQEIDFSDLATKADIQALRFEIESLRQATKADIDGLRQATTAGLDGARKQATIEIGNLRSDLLKWAIGAVGLQTVAIIGALVALARILAP